MNYIESIKPVASFRCRYSVIDQFAAGLDGLVLPYNKNRSRIDIYSPVDDFIYECRVVEIVCPVCRKKSIDITFLDNDSSVTGCDYCEAVLEY